MARRTSTGSRFYYILNLFMVMTYGAGGFVLLFWHMPGLPDTNRYIISAVLMLYSVYRGSVLYRRFKNRMNNE